MRITEDTDRRLVIERDKSARGTAVIYLVAGVALLGMYVLVARPWFFLDILFDPDAVEYWWEIAFYWREAVFLGGAVTSLGYGMKLATSRGRCVVDIEKHRITFGRRWSESWDKRSLPLHNVRTVLFRTVPADPHLGPSTTMYRVYINEPISGNLLFDDADKKLAERVAARLSTATHARIERSSCLSRTCVSTERPDTNYLK